MNLSTFYQGSKYQTDTYSNILYEREKLNGFNYSIFNNTKNKTLSFNDFINLQKSSKKSAELLSYCDQKGYTIRSLGDETAKNLNNQINTLAALQTIQNFYDMYISPVGTTDALYRLGEVTGKAIPGTVNSQTDKYGRLNTKSLYTTFVNYSVWNGSYARNHNDYYSALWFPPYKPSSIRPTSWKNISYNTSKVNNTSTMTMSQYLQYVKAQRQADLDAYNEDLIKDGGTPTQTEAEDTRLIKKIGKRGIKTYYPTFDLSKQLAARSSFTYRAPGFKAINDNINMIQWILEGSTGIVSTYLTEWDISLYLQEGLISDSSGKLPNIILLTHRLGDDNPSGYRDDRAVSWGVINCAVSKVYGHNKKSWKINSYPMSAYYTPYPNPYLDAGWTDTITDSTGQIIMPSYYKFAREGYSAYLAGYDINGKKRPNTIETKLMYQDFEGAALSGYEDWSFGSKAYKALYTTDDDGFSDIDTIFLSTFAGLYHKKDLIDQVEMAVFGTTEDGTMYDESIGVSSGEVTSTGAGTGSENEYVWDGGSGGNKWTPSSVFKGALTFLAMFNKKDSAKSAALATADNMNSSTSGNIYGAMQDSLGLVKQSTSGVAAATSSSGYLLGVDKYLTENSNGVGIPQNNPTLFGGPHGRYKSPKAMQSYYQTDSTFLRNVPRVDKLPNLTHTIYTSNVNGKTYDSDLNYYKGNEKFSSSFAASSSASKQLYEQSWSAGLHNLNYGIHSYSTAKVWKREKVYGTMSTSAFINKKTFTITEKEYKKAVYNHIHTFNGVTYSHYINNRYPYYYDTYMMQYDFTRNGILFSYNFTYEKEKEKYIYKYKKGKPLYTTRLVRVKRYYKYVTYYDGNFPKKYNNEFSYNYFGQTWTKLITSHVKVTYREYRKYGNWRNYIAKMKKQGYEYVSVDGRLQIVYDKKTVWWRKSTVDYDNSYYNVTLQRRRIYCQQWHYDWHLVNYNRYVLHNRPNYNWKIVRVQHYNVNTSSSIRGFWGFWIYLYRYIYGGQNAYYRYYNVQAANEDYELFIEDPTHGIRGSYGFYDQKYKKTVTFLDTNTEHEIMTNMVDWSRGIGATNKLMFLTRTTGDRPDCLFRCNVTHKLKPVYYWKMYKKKYSSRKTKTFWRQENGWKHYMSVQLNTTDVFYAGLSKPAFTSLNASSDFNHDYIGYSEPPVNGYLSYAQMNNNFFPKGNNSCKESRKSIYDLFTYISGRPTPHYNSKTGTDTMVSSFIGIKGKGILGDIPGLSFIGTDGGSEKFSDKLCSYTCNKLGANAAKSTAFKKIMFSMWEICGWDYGEVKWNGNTYRQSYGVPHYRRITPPNWWAEMILNMSLRNTFYRGDTTGPMTYEFSAYNAGYRVDLYDCGGDIQKAINYIGSRGLKFYYQDNMFTVHSDNILRYTVKYKTGWYRVKDSNNKEILEEQTHPILDTLYVRNLFIADKYYFTSYDIAPRYVWQTANSQIAYLKKAKELFCGKNFSFNYLRKIMQGSTNTSALISPRTYYLADPNNIYIEDPDGSTTKNGKKVSLCEEIYGYNPFIVSARKWFCNSNYVNISKQRTLRTAITNRINSLTSYRNSLYKYIFLNMKQFSYNGMVESWKTINQFQNIRNDDTVEDFFLAYLNVLYEARKYFINKRCNKQDGTLWACRHLEKMIPQVMASAISSSANVNPASFSSDNAIEKVAFYEVQNTTEKKVKVIEERAKNPNSTVKLPDDRVKTVYVKVRYTTEEAYNECQEKLKNKTLKYTDEIVVKVRPWSYIKKKNGVFKSKANGDTLNPGEIWNSSGYAIKYGNIKYAIKPRDGIYQLKSKEWKENEENKEKLKNNPDTNVSVKKYDKAKWYIKWGDRIGRTPIVYNLYGGTNIKTIMDLTKQGVKDPIQILCGAKQSSDFWKVKVLTKYPKAEGYQTQITLELYEYEATEASINTTENSSALEGAAAYAMWPIIEEQEDVIPNATDLSISLQSLGT